MENNQSPVSLYHYGFANSDLFIKYIFLNITNNAFILKIVCNSVILPTIAIHENNNIISTRQ
jgi:hypothetical protein